MKPVAKYNICKGISILLTVGTPITTMCICSDFFVHRPETAISAGGIFAILLTILFAKDKIVENFKIPSAFVLSTIILIFILMVQSIIEPLRYVCIATMCTSGVDELTFKRIYKRIEKSFPENADTNKFVGFMFTRSDKIYGGK